MTRAIIRHLENIDLILYAEYDENALINVRKHVVCYSYVHIATTINQAVVKRKTRKNQVKMQKEFLKLIEALRIRTLIYD